MFIQITGQGKKNHNNSSNVKCLPFPPEARKHHCPKLSFSLGHVYRAKQSVYSLEFKWQTLSLWSPSLYAHQEPPQDSFLIEAPVSLSGAIYWPWKPMATVRGSHWCFRGLCPMRTIHQGVMDGNGCVSLDSPRSTH